MNSTNDSHPVSWEELYFEVLDESDEVRRNDLVTGLEKAMLNRREDLSRMGDDLDEIACMERATENLLLLKLRMSDWSVLNEMIIT